MAAKKTGLGRGLNALIQSSSPAKPENPPPVPAPAPAAAENPLQVHVSQIVANPYQPRGRFEEEGLEELTASIKEMGILSPLLVRRSKEKGAPFQLVAGERRFRAAQRAGLKNVPVIVRDLTDLEALEVALVENLQRRDLNVIEEAEGYQRLMTEFGLTQEVVSQRVGKGRATVANALRLLALAPAVRDMVADGRISSGHAKVLLGLEIAAEQKRLAEACVRERWSVREIERRVAALRKPVAKKTATMGKNDIPADHLQHLTDQLHQRLGTSVRVLPTRTLPNGKKARGRVEIDFYSNDDLDRLLEILGITEAL